MWNVIETLLDLNKERKLGLELWQCEELAKWICLVFRKNIKDLDYVRADTHLRFRPESRIHPKEEYHVYTNIYAYGNNIKHFAVDPEEFAKLNLNEIISRNQDNTTALIYGLWQQQQKDIDK